MRETPRRWSVGRRCGAAAIALLMGAAPAAAKICDMKVYDAVNGKALGQADKLFKKEEQFIVCFTATEDGFVSLWDRIPFDGPVERLGPSPSFEPGKARPVKGGETMCFGDGKAYSGGRGYLLNMAADDGVGVGRMWLVYSSSADDHPDKRSFDSASLFENSFTRAFGAGALSREPGVEDRDEATPPDPSGCVAKGSLDFFYRVEQ